MWFDIITKSDLGVKRRVKSEKGFKQLLIATHFLWAYLKNRKIFASTFKISTRSVEGENLWHWVRIVGALKKYKIVWPTEIYHDPSSQIFIITVDGVNFKVNENRRHATLPFDRGEYSKKMNHAGLKYKIGINCYNNKVVWINGPFRADEHDKNVFDSALREKIPDGKLVVTDRVYGNKANKSE